MDSILGFLIALAGQMMMIPGWVGQQQLALHTTTQITTAQQLAELVNAATPFIQQNLSTGINLASTATATNATTISVAQLINANVGLPPNFAQTNPYGQTWEVQVLQPSPGNFQALVLGVGGAQLTDLAAAGVAAASGASGGFIPRNDSGIYTGGPSQAIGNQASWTVPTTGYHGITGGEPAGLIVLNNGQIQNSSLYRVAVPGQPQLNTMETALNMGGNDINGAGTVNVQKIVAPGGNSVQIGNSYYYGDTQNSAVRQSGYFAVQHADGTAADMGVVQNVFASGIVQSTSDAGYGATQLHSYGLANPTGPIYVEPASGNNMYLTTNGWNGTGQLESYFGSNYFQNRLTANEYVQVNGYAAAGAACSPNGLIGNSGSGPVFCRSGVWQSGAGVSQSVTYNVGGLTYADLGTHNFCTLSGTQNNFNTVVGNTYSAVFGNVNADWYYESVGHRADYGWATCFD